MSPVNRPEQTGSPLGSMQLTRGFLFQSFVREWPELCRQAVAIVLGCFGCLKAAVAGHVVQKKTPQAHVQTRRCMVPTLPVGRTSS